MHVAENAADLRRVLDSFANKKLVLIDTAGMSQRDVRLANQFTTLASRKATACARCWRCPPAPIAACLAEALKVFQAAKPEALIVTKLDEAAGLGGVLSLAIRSAVCRSRICPTASVCPRTCIARRPKRFWLLHNALKLSASGGGRPTSTSSRTASVTWSSPPMAEAYFDQAAGLRRLRAPRNVKVVAITGGKGGVGKTLTAVNLGAALARPRSQHDAARRGFRARQCRRAARPEARLNLEHVDQRRNARSRT